MTPDLDRFYTDHWRTIEDERVGRYEKLFAWRPEQAVLLAPAGIEPGHHVLDLGCGPGYLTAELASLVGGGGRAVGVDINNRFVADANERAKGATNLSYQVIVDHRLPFDDAAFDRVICKNVLEYVPDLAATLAEVVRVLKPGARAHAIDSDWGFVVVEPWPKATVERFFAAAAPAFKEPLIGRRLPAAFVSAGLDDVRVRISAIPDRVGNTLLVMRNMAGYVRTFGALSPAEVDGLMAELEAAPARGTYLFVLPQFLVTGSRPRST